MLTEMCRHKELKLNGKDMMSFEDYQYSNVNQLILNMPEFKDKNKKKKEDGELTESSQEESSGNSESDEEKKRAKKAA